MGEDKSKNKLKKEVEDEVTKMFESVLDYAQVACAAPDVYKVLRSKILRVGNNCIRNLKSKLDSYDIEFTATNEEIIEFAESMKR
jgi:hypothetical protein